MAQLMFGLSHGPIIDSSRQYYFPTVSSTVEDVHFNCFFPGKGPGMSVLPSTIISPKLPSRQSAKLLSGSKRAKQGFLLQWRSRLLV
jgi:hypothetical protein